MGLFWHFMLTPACPGSVLWSLVVPASLLYAIGWRKVTDCSEKPNVETNCSQQRSLNPAAPLHLRKNTCHSLIICESIKRWSTFRQILHWSYCVWFVIWGETTMHPIHLLIPKLNLRWMCSFCWDHCMWNQVWTTVDYQVMCYVLGYDSTLLMTPRALHAHTMRCDTISSLVKQIGW